MADKPIRVLLADDSEIALSILRRIFAKSAEVEVVGTAKNGQEALRLAEQLEPMVICTDLHMPVMDGLEFTERIMRENPRPILVISDAVHKEDADNVFRLLEAGALDVFPKPKGGSAEDYERVADELIRRVRILAGVRVFRKRCGKILGGATPGASTPPARNGNSRQPMRIVAIGASTGGPQALLEILTNLPQDFPVPLVCVQHISRGFLPGMVKWLSAHAKLNVTIGKTGETPVKGNVYFAPDDAHLEIDRSGKLLISQSDVYDGHRPSVTILFRSVAKYYRQQAVGVLLTGMGRDGAEGMLNIVSAGGFTLAESEDTCIVYGMPKQAIEAGAASCVLPLRKIAGKLKEICAGGTAANWIT